MTNAHIDPIRDVLATKNRELTKQLFREIAGAEPDNKWATRDIAKRVKDLIAGPIVDEPQDLDISAVAVIERRKRLARYTAAHPDTTIAMVEGTIADAELPFESLPLALVKVEPGPAQGDLILTLRPDTPEHIAHLTALRIGEIMREETVRHVPDVTLSVPPAYSCRCHPGKNGPCPARVTKIAAVARRVDKCGRQAAKTSHYPGSLGAMARGRPCRPAPFLGAKAILAALKPGTMLEHTYRDATKPPCKVEVVTPPNETGKGGSYRYKLNRYSSLREIARLDSGQDFNILYFFNLAPWPKHKDRSKKKKSV